MAIKISNLPTQSLANLSANDVLPITDVETNITRKVTVGTLNQLLAANVIGYTGSSGTVGYTGSVNNEMPFLVLTAAPPYTVPVTLSNTVDFERPNNSPTTVDVIDTGLTIKRGNNGGIYNSANNVEASYNGNVSPLGTEWNSEGWNDLADVKARTYTTFELAANNGHGIGSGVVDKEFVMHDTVMTNITRSSFTFGNLATAAAILVTEH